MAKKQRTKKLKYTSAQRSKAAKLHWKRRLEAKKAALQLESTAKPGVTENDAGKPDVWISDKPALPATMKGKRNYILNAIALRVAEVIAELNDGEAMSLLPVTREVNILTNRIAQVTMGEGTNH